MNRLKPKRPDYVRAVRAHHLRAAFSQEMGIELAEIEPGRLTASLPLRPTVTQQLGYAHAGIVATLADVVCGLAAYSLMPEKSEVLSVNINLSLLCPARGNRLRGDGRFVTAGKRLYFTEADIYAVDDTGEKLVARASATMTAV